jgi:ligand-binding sensor domain-containing protein/putative methionine-R-sulfoxide reductase with GAF domain/two-component sensor histidine kinase
LRSLFPYFRKISIAAAIFLSAGGSAFTQLPDFHVQLLNESNGIQTANITALARDADGFLWVLSNRMVQRYDGQSARRIEVRGEELLDIAVDSANRVWVSSATGIKKYVSDHRGFEEVRILGSAGARFNKLHVGRNKQVWAMSATGLYVYNETQQAFEPYNIKGLTATRFDRRLLYGPADQLFFTSGPAVYIWNTATKTLKEIPFKNVRNITALTDNIAWLTDWNLQSYELNISAGTVTPIQASQFEPSLTSPFVLIKNAFRLSGDDYFVSANHGCYCYNISTRIFRKCSLYHNGIRLRDDENAFPNYMDRERNFWMILDEGIVFFRPHVHTIGWLRSQGTRDNNWNNDIRSIAEDEQGNLWLATLNGFTRLNIVTGESKSYRPVSFYSGYSFPSVRGLVYDGRNLIVGPTHGGVLIFDPVTEKFRKPVIVGDNKDSLQQAIETEFISRIYTRKDGTHLVLARSGTYLIYDHDYKIRALSFAGASSNVQAVAEDSRGNTWFGSYNGLICTNDSFRVLFTDTSFAPSNYITALLMTNDTAMLAGAVGLFEMRYSNGRTHRKMIVPELSNQRIHVLFRDKLGKYWIGADNGLYRYTEYTGKLEWFDVADNVQNKRFNPNSVMRSANNYVFLGGYNGLNYFIPEKITSRAEKLNVIVSGLRVNQDDSSYLNTVSPVSLRHYQQSIEFRFTTPYFYNPQKVQYRYRMQGLDSGWVDNGRNNTVRFSALNPGNYTFRVAASLDGINWFEGKRSYSFVIHSAFWQTGWFIAACVLLVAGIVYAFFNASKKRMQRREMQKMIDYFALSGHDHSTVDDILWDIARNCISRLDFEDCVIYLLDDERKVLVQKAAYGIKNPTEREIFNPIEIPLGKGIVGSVAATGKPELIGDTSKDSRYIVDDANRLSELSVPIIHGDKVLGVIDSEHHRRNFFNRNHLTVLLSVASICSAKIAKVLAQQAAQEKENRMKELDHLMKESRLAALQSQMNPHFIFNAMNSIQRFTLENDVENANKYISRFSRLLRMVLQHSEKNAITLEDELQMLQLYLEIESLRMNDAFTFQLEVDEEIETDAVKIPGMTVQPFVENALSHGLAMKPGEKRLLIRFHMPEDRLLLCEVTDNGIGREQASLLKKKKETMLPHHSKGISLVKERLSLYNGRSVSRITFIDLNTEEGQPAGTSVQIEIPVL